MMRFMLAPQIGQTITLSADPASADMLSALVASLVPTTESPSIEITSTSIKRRNIYPYPERAGAGNNLFIKTPNKPHQ
jgi:hypothetical protein